VSQSSSRTDFAVVLLGASAGGLAVLQKFFAALPSSTDHAFVVVQHLDAERPSLSTEILARSTGMRVQEATDGARLVPNEVYVMPAHADLVFVGDSLRLVPRGPAADGPHLPIDGCMKSLAAELGSRAIGVVLSGTGSDGAAGVAAVRDGGGTTYAQDPATASSPNMPQAAIATGCVDVVSTPEGIAAEIRRRGIPAVIEVKADDVVAGGAVTRILDLVRRVTGIDFSQYRQTMVHRRIARRAALRRAPNLVDYAAMLASDADEVHQLQHDLLIGVTSFFRDPAVFDALQATVFPGLLRDRAADDPLRIWVPGCATGEEAYSIAICLDEYLTSVGASPPVQVYASDLNAEAVATARTGSYATAQVIAHVGATRWNAYFTPIDDTRCQVNKRVREMCLFTTHDLLADPPFSRLDLISCRNVLMYLPRVQQQVLRLFHFALRPKGILVVGSAETVPSSDLFAVLDRTNGIHGKRALARRLLPTLPTSGRSRVVPPPASPDTIGTGSALAESEPLRKRVDRFLLGRFGPVAIVVSENLEVLEIRGDAKRYLALPAGEMSFDLLKLVPATGLFLHIERAVRAALRSGSPVRAERVLYAADAGMREITLEAVPLGVGAAVLVLFEPVPESAAPGPDAGSAPTSAEGGMQDARVARLTHDLEESRRRFLGLIEEHDAAKAELQYSAEEALSANEELRSVNEELETAKEELQCTNEELATLNAELHAKNEALRGARDQALSIVAAVRQPMLVLDRSLRVVVTNDAYAEVFGESAASCERRPVCDLSAGLWDGPEMRGLLRALTAGDAAPAPFEFEAHVHDTGVKYLTISGKRIDGFDLLLVSIEDRTRRRLDEDALARAAERLRETEKMEALGRLAGGVAHDFNNLLTAIHGYSGLLRTQLAGDAPALEMIDAIQSASQRATALTRQLLAFGRRQVLQPRIVDLNTIVADLERLLHRLGGTGIEFRVEAAPDLWCVQIDPGELGRVIMNLALNARDAMPSGGTPTVRTANVVLSPAEAAELGLQAGRHVHLVVADTGAGMTPATLAHVFEPFFTTKELGRGSGLGLSTVMGIVAQSAGAIRCESDLGVGTTFRVWLPAVVGRPAPVSSPCDTEALARGDQVVLLVEDEEPVRKLIRRILRDSGYTVLEAASGAEALTVHRTHGGPIHLLLTDVMMPGPGGPELAEQLRRESPDLRVLFMSGYAPDDRLEHAIEAGAQFLQKPFTPRALTNAVCRVLDAHGRAGPG